MQARISLDAHPQSVGRARRFCSTTLQSWNADDDLIATCVLLVSELATNAVLHAGTPFTVTIRHGERLRVEVVDGDPRLPQPRDYGLHAMSGRGLHLVRALARSSGAIPAEEGADGRDGGAVVPGKTVWFELDWVAQMVP